MKHNRYRRRTTALLFLISGAPSLIVGAVWYVWAVAGTDASFQVSWQALTLPVMLLGVLPALILAFIFARILTEPLARIYDAAQAMAGGHYAAPTRYKPGSEFAETLNALAQAQARLQQKLSETDSEMGLIAAERNKLRGVLNSMSDGVFAIDRDGRIILFNKAASELTGRSIAEVAGQLAEKVMPFRLGSELVMTRWLDSQLGTDRKLGEWHGLELHRADGASLFVDVRAITMTDDPNGIRALVTFHDLTKEHALEEMKVDFVALAAHELRTPVTEIRSYLDIMLNDHLGLRAEAKELTERCATSVANLAMLINNLLGVARIEHGEMTYAPKSTNWREFLDPLKPNLEMRARDSGVDLEFSVAGRLPQLQVDDTGMGEVIKNLVNNAIAHCEPGTGKVRVATRMVDGEVETSITDNGSGIPSAAMHHLFTKFFRYEGLKSTNGTGLGLFISKAIIEKHGGYIWAESEVGKGSVFTFRLPAGTAKAGQKSAREAVRKQSVTPMSGGAHGWIKNDIIH